MYSYQLSIQVSMKPKYAHFALFVSQTNYRLTEVANRLCFTLLHVHILGKMQQTSLEKVQKSKKEEVAGIK